VENEIDKFMDSCHPFNQKRPGGILNNLNILPFSYPSLGKITFLKFLIRK